VVATFDSAPPIKNAAVPSSYYRLLSEAVSSSGYGASVQVQSRSIDLVERLQVGRGVRLTVKGGYDSGFRTVNGSTVLRGRINITDGKLVANRLKIAPMPPVNRLLLLGDSNTEQLNLATPERWSTLLSQSYPTKTLLNAAKGGQTTKGALGTMNDNLWEHRPDRALVMYGTNDSIRYDYGVASVPPEEFEANIRTMIAAIRGVGAVPVLLTVIPTIEGTGSDGYYYSRHPAEFYQSVGGANAWIERYNSIVRRVASDSGVMLVDIWDRFRQAAGSVADASLIASGLLDRSGTHLTAAGSNLIHQSLLAQQVIEESGPGTEVPVLDPDQAPAQQ
jgi:lysophospholipase L1-like esterase